MIEKARPSLFSRKGDAERMYELDHPNATKVANVAEAQTIIDGAELALRSDLATKTRNRGKRTEIETLNTEYWQLNY